MINNGNPNQLNQVIQGILQMKNMGKNPKMIMNMMLQQNPQLQQTLTQLQNMANGRSPKEFLMQLAKQGGVNEQNLQALQKMFGK